uniref:Beta-defensin n=2 Tax=Felis catus TaxID=9685 RepID=A0ABI8AE68_FELCA
MTCAPCDERGQRVQTCPPLLVTSSGQTPALEPPEVMKRFLLTLAVLLLLSWAIPGSTEKCWNLRGSCREKCIKNEKSYVFCMSGKLCCVKPKFQPKSLQT